MKISVITVTYNCLSVVNDCLNSVKTQSHADVEHIVIDGASDDGTLGLLEANRSDLAILRSEPDAGIYDAMNKGIRFANGDIVGFLNADDFYENDKVLAKVAQCFEDDPALEACYSDLIYVDRFDTSRTIRYWKSGKFVAGAFSLGWCPPHPTFFVRRSVFERFGGFNLTYRIAADVELMMHFLEVRKLHVTYVPDVWVKMRVGGVTNKSWRNVWIQNQEVLLALKDHRLANNFLFFFTCKLFSRVLQFMRRPST